MALRELMIGKDLELLSQERSITDAELAELKTRSETLAEAISEVTKREELDTITEDVEKVNSGIELKLKALEDLDLKIKNLEIELESLNVDSTSDTNTNTNTNERNKANIDIITKRSVNTMINRETIAEKELERQLLRERVETTEYRSFLDEFKTIQTANNITVDNTRGITDEGLLIPDILLNPILDKIRVKSKIQPLVDTRRLRGNGKIVVAGDIPEAVWVDCCDPTQEISMSFRGISLECHKVAGYLPVCNATLADSYFNLGLAVEDALSTAIAKSMDKAILTNSLAGAPQGITPLLTAIEIQAKGDISDYSNIMTYNAYLDDTLSLMPSNMYAVMNRKTYATYIQKHTMAVNSAGQVVSQSILRPVLSDGTPIILTNYMADGEILFGDFSYYILGERQAVTITRSEHQFFIQDNTVFKGVARYDGKVIDEGAFVLMRLVTA